MSRMKYFLHVFREESRFVRSQKSLRYDSQSIIREECSLAGIHGT